MKKLVLLLAISMASLSSFADAEYARVSLAQIDIKLEGLVQEMNAKIVDLDDTTDLTEGKVRATIINTFDLGVEEVQTLINELETNSSSELKERIVEALNNLESLVNAL